MSSNSGSEDRTGTKTGRKGDTRMHKAVAARLANPKMSLYYALTAGGFVYKSDEDPNLVDSENVSLAQRKNQLSRRVRLAKRHPRKETDGGMLDDDPSLMGSEEHVDSHDESTELLAKNHPGFHAHSVSRPVIQSEATTSTVTSGAQTSGVAIQSLSKTAASMGMSLEQLAVALSNKQASLSELLFDSIDQQEVALNYYSSEIKNLYAKALKAANYPPEVCNNPQSNDYMQFAMEAWKREGQRLQAYRTSSCTEPPLQANTSSSPVSHGAHQNEHHHAHNHDDSTSSCVFESGRHLHNLGECGHTAILHQPENGPSHIDFLVGNQVECYANIKPVSTEASQFWPSRYKCQELECECPDHPQLCRNESTNCCKVKKPITFDVNEIDLSGPEWNKDFSGDSILGMFKLGTDTTVLEEEDRRSAKRQRI